MAQEGQEEHVPACWPPSIWWEQHLEARIYVLTVGWTRLPVLMVYWTVLYVEVHLSTGRNRGASLDDDFTALFHRCFRYSRPVKIQDTYRGACSLNSSAYWYCSLWLCPYTSANTLFLVPRDVLASCRCFFCFVSCSSRFIIFALFLSFPLPAVCRKSDPGSHSRLTSPPLSPLHVVP